MAKGNCGSNVSFHEGGKPGNRTWLVVASGTTQENVAADIRQVAVAEERVVRSAMPPKVETRWHGCHLHVTAEGGDVATLISAIVAALADVHIPVDVEA